jgi:hypothetical protein
VRKRVKTFVHPFDLREKKTEKKKEKNNDAYDGADNLPPGIELYALVQGFVQVVALHE